MSWDIEERVRTSLADQADAAGLPSFTSDDAVLRGRAARRHRRAVGAVVGVVGVVAALVVGESLIRPEPRALPPVTQMPSPSRQSPSPTLPPSSLPPPLSPELAGLRAGAGVPWSLLVSNEIVPPGGKRVKIPLPSGMVAVRASQVPGGWVVEAGFPDDQEPSSVWFLEQGGGLRRIASAHQLVVAEDGRHMATVTPDELISFRELPSGKALATVRYSVGFGPHAAAILGDRVVLDGVQGDGSHTDLAVWNTTTGAITRAAPSPIPHADLHYRGRVGESTSVLLEAGGETEGQQHCLSVVAFADRLRAGAPACGLYELGILGPLSAGGTRIAAARVDPQGRGDYGSMTISDIRAGRHGFVPLGLPATVDASPLRWENEAVLILLARVPGSDQRGRDRHVLLRCRWSGEACERVHLPVPYVSAEAIVDRHGV